MRRIGRWSGFGGLFWVGAPSPAVVVIEHRSEAVIAKNKDLFIGKCTLATKFWESKVGEPLFVWGLSGD